MKHDELAWHAFPAEHVAAQRKVSVQNGLGIKEAKGRLQEPGANRLPDGPRRSSWLRFVYISILVTLRTKIVNFCHYDIFRTDERANNAAKEIRP
jgi:hypothetical protein